MIVVPLESQTPVLPHASPLVVHLLVATAAVRITAATLALPHQLVLSHQSLPSLPSFPSHQ